ncbi:hypothetical protein FGADI_5912 [Fusarium gaditjirri]|uniref:Major facilitator superfamily (MFS) profile domain-containing protein n=1 Tax=Fusarium gaditjirri TaxID=282569 RepID=A0A8H4T972_9HYPO|nr:hypothetical protein FGADI_5912 [Fusarium gaditjirri]
MAYFSVFPYVYLMAQHNSSSRTTDIGGYVAFFETLFWAAQALTSIFWGTMVDRFGGKTMLICILLGTAISSVVFGFASSLWEMALCRCFMGMVSGGDVVIRAMIGKRCKTQTEATRGFSLSSFAGNIGMASGLLIGHALVNHVSQYSRILKAVSLLKQHPFCLPGITIGVMSVTCAIVTTLLMEDAKKETNGAVYDTPSTWISLRELARSRGVIYTISTFIHISLFGSTFAAVATLSLYTELSQGGLELPGHEIALYVACQGGFSAYWLFLIYPALYRRFGTQSITSSTLALFPFFFLIFSIMNAFVRPDSEAGFFVSRLRQSMLACKKHRPVLESLVCSMESQKRLLVLYEW